MDENTIYIMAEFQDHRGTVIYWHTDTRVVWFPDGTSLHEVLDTDATDEMINAILA